MRGSVTQIHKVYDGIDKKLIIPVYQRNYDWTPKQCSRLFDDLEELLSDEARPKHFFGALVGYSEDTFNWVVIDGQQRMTTVSLLMLALAHALEAGEVSAGGSDPDSGTKLAQRLVNNYLTLSDGGDQKFKLKPVKDDAKAYAKLFGPEAHFLEESKITANYRYFRDRLRHTQFNATDLWQRGISQLEVMLLDLEAHDDPQRIFESLNSTGLALKEADKIRNLVLMDLASKEQERLYTHYWNPMEVNTNFKTDEFIRWYLVAQTGKTPKKDGVFDFFKSYLTKGDRTAAEVVTDLFEFSEIERTLRTASTGERVVDRRLRQANLILGDVVKPFMWLVYRDVLRGEVTPEDFEEVIAIIETYIFRRVVSSVAANALNKIFATAYSDLRKMRHNGEAYSRILAYMLMSRNQSGRLPSDQEFGEAFRNRDFYHMRGGYRSYTFDRLEIGSSKDTRDIASQIAKGDLTIEHIMPQKLTSTWREELGSDSQLIHADWVNRIANLTITGYNSEYSNQPFLRKLTMEGGFADSPYRLNSYIKEQSNWGLTQLKERTEVLTALALKTWPMPTVDFEPPSTTLPTITLGSEQNYTNLSVVAVEIEGSKVPVGSWKDALVVVLNELLELDRERVISHAPQDQFMLMSRAAMIENGLIVRTAEGLKIQSDPSHRYQVIDPALAVRIHSSTNAKTGLLRRLCEAIDYNMDDIVFYLRKEDQPAVGSVDSAPRPASYDCNEAPADHGEFTELFALIPQVEEYSGTSLREGETQEIRTMFLELFQPFLLDFASFNKILAGRSVDSLVSSQDSSTLTAEECLACLSSLVVFSNLQGPRLLHEAFLNGRVTHLLKALRSAVPSPTLHT